MSKNAKIWLGRILGVLVYACFCVFAMSSSRRGAEGILYMELGKKSDFKTALLERFYPPPSLWEVAQALGFAKEDEKIKGLFLKISLLDCAWGEVEELRKAILEFSEKKPSVAYIEYATDKEYYLASACDTVIVPPLGLLLVDGLSAQGMFQKGLWEKLGVEWKVIKAGKHKSAPEVFTRDKFSEEARKNLEKLLDDIFSVYAEDVADARKIPFESVVNEGPYLVIEKAKEKNLVDRTGYFEDVVPERKVKVRDYLKRIRGRRIPVVEINGEINEKLAEKVIKKLKKLEKSSYKVVILRIDSPGGDVLSADLIWREVKKLGEKKHVLVSCGGVCASGGYYIASGGEWICALPTTITGSIGVFTLLPRFEELYKKIGISFDTVKKGEHADFLFPGKELSDYEERKIQEFIDYAYETFLERVSEGRKIPLDSLRGIAEGIVYSGLDALRLGLVDKLGGIEVALDKAKEILGVKGRVIGYKYGRKRWAFEDILDFSSRFFILYLLPVNPVIE